MDYEILYTEPNLSLKGKIVSENKNDARGTKLTVPYLNSSQVNIKSLDNKMTYLRDCFTHGLDIFRYLNVLHCSIN